VKTVGVSELSERVEDCFESSHEMVDCGACQVKNRGMNYDFMLTLTTSFGNVADSSSKQAVSDTRDPELLCRC
jgi:hypothetical protein